MPVGLEAAGSFAAANAVPLTLAGSALAGSAISANAAKSAAKTQATAATAAGTQQTQLGQEALDYQKAIDTRTQGQFEPYISYGSSALPGLSRLLGLGPDGSAGIEAQLQSLPGYAFARDQGVKAINNSIGSKGLTGAQSKGIARFVTGMADQTYGAQVDRLNQAAQTGVGAVGTGGGIGLGTGSNVGGTLTGIGQAIRDAITGAASAQAGGTIGSANAAGSGLNGVGNALLISRLLGGQGGGTTTGLYQPTAIGNAAYGIQGTV